MKELLLAGLVAMGPSVALAGSMRDMRGPEGGTTDYRTMPKPPPPSRYSNPTPRNTVYPTYSPKGGGTYGGQFNGTFK